MCPTFNNTNVFLNAASSSDSGFSLMTGLSSLLPLNKTRYTVLHNVCSITLTTTQALSPLYDFLSLPFSLPTCSWCNLSICKSNSPVFLIYWFSLFCYTWLFGALYRSLSLSSILISMATTNWKLSYEASARLSYRASPNNSYIRRTKYVKWDSDFFFNIVIHRYILCLLKFIWCIYKMAATPGGVMALGSVIVLLLGQLNLQGSTQYNDAISCIFSSEHFVRVFCHCTCCLAEPAIALV